MTDLFALAAAQNYPASALYLVASPIGNLADITLRALHLLDLVDRVAAEDTRHTRQLLARYSISKPLIAAHQHNERMAAQQIIDYLQAGERIAYLSDAGTPGIADPGAKIVDAVRAVGLAVVPLPGCSALTTALSAAGSWAETFTFIGFLPSKARQRAERLNSLLTHESALVLYEAPHRIIDAVSSLAAIFGHDRKILIARELTKVHEMLHLCQLGDAASWFAADPNRQRGEFVLVVEGAATARCADQQHSGQHDAMLKILLAEVPASTAVKLACTLTGASRKELYARVLMLKQEPLA